MPIVTAVSNDTIGIQVVEFTALHDLGNGTKLVYDLIFLDWNNDPNNPLWASSTSVQIINGPATEQWIFGGNIINGSIVEGPDFFEFRCDEIEITNEITGNLHVSNDFVIRGMK